VFEVAAHYVTDVMTFEFLPLEDYLREWVPSGSGEEAAQRREYAQAVETHKKSLEQYNRLYSGATK